MRNPITLAGIFYGPHAMQLQRSGESSQFDWPWKLRFSTEPAVDPREHPQVARGERPDSGGDRGQHASWPQYPRYLFDHPGQRLYDHQSHRAGDDVNAFVFERKLQGIGSNPRSRPSCERQSELVFRQIETDDRTSRLCQLTRHRA